MATVGLEWSTALSTRMPLGRLLSLKLIRGIVVWALERPAKAGEKRSTTRSVNRALSLRKFINYSRKMTSAGLMQFEDSMINSAVAVALNEDPRGPLWFWFVSPCPEGSDTVYPCPSQRASWLLETSLQECGRDP